MAVALAFCWQTLTVHYCYGGNWTELFCAGDHFHAPPPVLASERISRFRNSYGYDGQMYHYMAHDPFLTRGFQSALDEPRFRYRRILVPLAAWLVAAGQDRFIDSAYFAVVLFCVFLGTLWVAAIIRGRGAHPAWALGFLFIPGVALSLDRMTVDVALIALTAGAVHYARRKNWVVLLVVCTAAGLVRESGLLITAGIVAFCGLQRRFAWASAMLLCVVPALAWYSYVFVRTPTVAVDHVSLFPFIGILVRLLRPVHYWFGSGMNVLVTLLDYAALSGIVFAVIYCARHIRRLLTEPDGPIVFGFIALVAFVSLPGVWADAYGFARAYSPLILIVALDFFRTRSVLAVLPLALTAPRIGIALQLVAQIFGVDRGMFGFVDLRQ
jgi:hypothetical protein